MSIPHASIAKHAPKQSLQLHHLKQLGTTLPPPFQCMLLTSNFSRDALLWTIRNGKLWLRLWGTGPAQPDQPQPVHCKGRDKASLTQGQHSWSSASSGMAFPASPRHGQDLPGHRTCKCTPPLSGQEEQAHCRSSAPGQNFFSYLLFSFTCMT